MEEGAKPPQTEYFVNRFCLFDARSPDLLQVSFALQDL